MNYLKEATKAIEPNFTRSTGWMYEGSSFVKRFIAALGDLKFHAAIKEQRGIVTVTFTSIVMFGRCIRIEKAQSFQGEDSMREAQEWAINEVNECALRYEKNRGRAYALSEEYLKCLSEIIN